MASVPNIFERVHDDPVVANFNLVPVDDEPDSIDLFADDDQVGLLAVECLPPAVGLLGGLADWLDAQACYYRSQQASAAEWLAGKIGELAAACRRHEARTPAELDERMRLEDLERDHRLRDQGWDAAQPGPYHYDEMRPHSHAPQTPEARAAFEAWASRQTRSYKPLPQDPEPLSEVPADEAWIPSLMSAASAARNGGHRDLAMVLDAIFEYQQADVLRELAYLVERNRGLILDAQGIV